MRYFSYLHARRRQRSHFRAIVLVLCVLLSVGSFYSIYRNQGVYRRALSEYLITQAEERLGRKIEIGCLEFNFLEPAILKQVAIRDVARGSVFRARTIKVDHKFGQLEAIKVDVIGGELEIKGKTVLSNINGKMLISKDNFSFGPLTAKALGLTSVSLKGTLDNFYVDAPQFSGYFSYSPEELLIHRIKYQDYLVLSGKVDLESRKFMLLTKVDEKRKVAQLKPIFWEEAALSIGDHNQALIYGDLSNFPQFKIETRANHLNLGGVDVLTDITLKGKLEGSSLTGRLFTTGSIFNHKPFYEVDLDFKVSNKKLEIISLKVGDKFEVKGKVGLSKNYPIYLYLMLNNLDIEELILLTGFEPRNAASGIINGEFEFRGPYKNPNLKGYIRADQGGNLGKIKFRALNINIKGELPIIRFTDSRIWRDDSYLKLNGELDLRHIDNKDSFDTMEITSDNRTIVWKGWDISHKKDETEYRLDSESALSAGKDVGEDFRINFNTYINDESSNLAPSKESIELEYRLDETKSIKMELRQDDEFLSVERKMKF